MKINDVVAKPSRLMRTVPSKAAKAYARGRYAEDADDKAGHARYGAAMIPTPRHTKTEPYLRAKQREQSSGYELEEEWPEPDDRPRGKLKKSEPDGWEEAEHEAQDWIDAEQEAQRILGIDEADDSCR